MYSIKDREDLEQLEELDSLQNQVNAVRLQDKPGKQNFHEVMSKTFETVTDKIKNTSEDLTKTMMLTSKENNKALENLNDKLLQKMTDRGKIASFLLAPLSKITNLENTIQLKLEKDSNSNRVIDLLLHNTIPITLYENLPTIRDTGKVFEIKRDLLKMTTNKNYFVDLASLSVEKLMYDFAMEMYLDMKATGNKTTRNRSFIRLPKSPAIMASGIS